MPSALIALFVTTLVVVSTRGEPPLNIGLGDIAINDGSSLDASYGAPTSGGYSDGSLSGGYSDGVSSLGGYSDSGSKGEIIATPAGKGVRYAGPIVYTNEKPPVIHFPRPPKPKKGKSGKGLKAQSIKYVPMPHHDLPILIYQSDINPPIHVVSPPKGHSFSQSYGVPSASSSSLNSQYGVPSGSFSSSSSFSSNSYSAPQSDYGAPLSNVPAAEYGQPKVVTSSNSYGVPSVSSSSYSAPTVSSGYGVPAASSVTYGAPVVTSNSYGPPKALKASYGPPKGDFGGLKSEYGPPKSQYGPPKKAAPLPHIIYAGHPPIHIFQQPPIYMSAPNNNYGPPPTKSKKGHSSFSSSFSSFGSPSKASSSSVYTEYGAPSKASSSVYTEYGAPSKGHSSFSSYSKGQYKGDNRYSSSSSKGHKGDKGGFGSHFGSAFGSHFGFGKSSFSFSLPKFNYGGHGSGHSKGHGSSHGHSHHQKTKYVVAPKAWNKPPIIIYQGVRPPVTVYETPATGGYSDGGLSGGYSSSSISSPVEVAPVTHSVNPIALSPPLDGAQDPHAHVAGTDAPGNPASHGVDLTYGISRISPLDAGQLVDPRHKTHYTSATARSIWIPNYGLPAVQYQAQQNQPAALYVSDLTSAGQNYQIVRRSDLLDESILYGISELRSQQEKTGNPTPTVLTLVKPSPSSISGSQPIAESRMDVLPNYLSTTNENTLNSIPISYSSVIVPSAGPGDADVASSAAPVPESTSKSS